MQVVKSSGVPSVRQRVSDEEWQARVELAAAYRLVAHYGWTHLINNHISVRVPGTEDQFLINPYGLLYEQITASSLVKIDVDGNILEQSPYEVNRAGFVIHSAIHMARKDLHAIIHTHTVAGPGGVGARLRPAAAQPDRHALLQAHRLSRRSKGVANDLDERERIVADLGDHKCLIMRHHGLLTAGVNIGEAFNLMYYLEKSCETQMMVLASNQPYSLPSRGIVREVGAHLLGQRPRARPRLAGADEARRPDRPVVPELRRGRRVPAERALRARAGTQATRDLPMMRRGLAVHASRACRLARLKRHRVPESLSVPLASLAALARDTSSSDPTVVG